jgi:flagellin
MRENPNRSKTAFRRKNRAARTPVGRKSRRNYTMRINTNLTAMNTFTQYTANNNKIGSAVAKLSSGYAINTAADNAAGLAISEKMRAQIRGLNKASTNAQDAISLVQTAEGSLEESTQILQRMRELAVQSASDTNEDEIDRTALQDEFAQLQQELNDIARNTSFNKKNLLDGSLAATKKHLTNAKLQNSGMTVELGNAATGNYNFSVTTKLERAAVEGKKPNSVELVEGSAESFFTNELVTNTAELSTGAAASDLLNGNYVFSATYGEDKSITVIATGDNGQTFEAKISQHTLEALETATDGDLKIDMVFNAEANDAFEVTVGLSGNIAPTENNFITLADNISKLTVSIAGGVTAQEAEYGVYANLTGAESIKLEAGMDSVSFSNGVKVNFDKLTTSSVDTTNQAKIAGEIHGTDLAAGAGQSGVEIIYTNFKAFDDAYIPESTELTDFAIDAAANAGGIELTATIAGVDFTAQLTTDQVNSLGFADTAADGATNSLQGIVFSDDDGNKFTLDLRTTYHQAISGTSTAVTIDDTRLVAAASANGVVTGAGHNYAKTFGKYTATSGINISTASNFSVESTKNAGLTFQVGANEGDSMVIHIDKMDANYLGVESASVATRSAASAAIRVVDKAINQVSSQRAYLGAIQNRLDHKIANLTTSAENLTSAESLIRDVDMAKEMTNFTNANILQQAATAMLAQANALPQNVLSLIGG